MPRPSSSKPQSKVQRLQKAVADISARYGQGVIVPAAERPRKLPPYVPTGFAQLDAVTGCKGIPLHAITLFTGPTTSGKLTVAYKVLSNAQRTSSRRKPLVAVLDMTLSADVDYIARCGVDLEHTLFVRPPAPDKAVQLLFDLVRGYGLRILLVDGLADLLRDRTLARMFDAALPQLTLALKAAPCAVICLDEPRPPWLRWLRIPSSAIAHHAALHVELQRETWLERAGEVYGYQAQSHLIQSDWARAGQTARVAIEFNGTVKARATW